MKLKSIEPTPNPNSMKLNLDEALPKGVSITYLPHDKVRHPLFVQRLLEVPGVQSLYHCLDFMAIQRVPSADWETLLSQARQILNGGDVATETPRLKAEGFGEVKVHVQHFRRIPMLVKVANDTEEQRVPLPQRFGDAVERATPSSPNMLLERQWIPKASRYGELREVGEAVAQELDAAHDQTRLDALVQQAFELGKDAVEARLKPTPEELKTMLAAGDWKQRYAALEAMGADPAHLPELLTALRDPQSNVRRMAVVYLGLLKEQGTLSHLCEALKDPAVAVRRLAGDALNEWADPDALPPMIVALGDPNKLVRWRAARFLYELGNEGALQALHAAENDTEFEVRMQVRQAIERIQGGLKAQGPVWMQMTRK